MEIDCEYYPLPGGSSGYYSDEAHMFGYKLEFEAVRDEKDGQSNSVLRMSEANLSIWYDAQVERVLTM